MRIKARVATNIASDDLGFRLTDEALADLAKQAPGLDILMPTAHADTRVGRVVSAQVVSAGAITYVEVEADIDQLWLVARGVTCSKDTVVEDGLAVISKLLMPRLFFRSEPDIDDSTVHTPVTN